MFIAQSDKFGWQQEQLELFDALMQIHPTIIIEHYSGYLQDKHIQKSVTRKNLYWEPKQTELIENLKREQQIAWGVLLVILAFKLRAHHGRTSPSFAS